MKKLYAILFLLCMLSCAVMAGNRCNSQVSASSPGINVSTLPIIPGSRDSIILPFYEDWAAGNFETNNWSFDPAQSNWSVNTTKGNPAPSAQFGWSPQLSNYNFALVSDTIDATAIMDNVTLKFDINLDNFSYSTLEGLAVEVFDGTTWQMVHDYTNSNGSFNWISESYNITQWAAGHPFKVRFRAYGADSYNINYWYVDNIKIYQQVVGNIAGTVTKLSDNTPVAGATITMTNALSGSYTTTTIADGTYAINGIEAGIYTLTLEKEGYNVISEEDTVIGNQTVTRNYQLTAPTIAVDPDSLTVTVTVGQTATRDLTITNSGNGPLAWSGHLQSNKKQVSIPASNGNFEHTEANLGIAPMAKKNVVVDGTNKGAKGSTAYGFDVNNGAFMSFDVDDPSNPTTIASVPITPFGGTFDATHSDFMYVIDYNDGAIKKVDVATGDVTTVGPAGLQSGYTPTGLTCDKSTGNFYASSTNSTESLLYTIDPATGAATLIGPTGIPALIDITIDGTGQMYGYDIIGDNAYMIDKATGASTVIGSIGYDANYAQGMSWDPESDNIYLSAYNNASGTGELRILDKVSGNTQYIGTFGDEIDALAFPGSCCGNWAYITPNSGVIAPGGTATVTVTFDGNYIPPQKDILAGTLVFESVPDVGQATVALYMTEIGPWNGSLNGVVTHGATPVEGATVTATRKENPVYVYSMVTGADGTYHFDDVIYGTYDVTAVKEGFNPYSDTNVIITTGQTTVHNIAMVAPTMVIDPLSITEYLLFGQTVTRIIHITNNGDGVLDWTADVQTNIKKQASIPASDGNFEHTSASAGVAPVVNKTNVTSAYKGAKGSIAYGFDVNNGIFMSFDMDDPSNPTTIASVTVMPFGGTFDATHTDFMYIIDYNDGNIKTVDITTGNVTTVGPAGLQSGDTPTGLTCDKTDGTLYATSTNGAGSMLYSIDPATGASTIVGPTGIPALIDIAIDGGGQMYGYDIVGDNAYMIDKTSGASTLIGSIGFNASYAQGMGWDPASDAIYMAAYNAGTSAGELRLFDKTTGNTAVIGSLSGEIDGFAFPGGSSSWLTVSPRHGTVPPGITQDVTVTLDGNYIPPRKDSYDGTITFASDPNVGTVIVPVTLIPNEDYGTLTGTVTHNGIPVAGVTLYATHNGMSYVTTSGNNGVYTFENLVPSTYSVTAEATGYNTFSTTGVIIGFGQTTTLPINLTAPTMNISPDSLAISLNPNESGTLSLTMSNNGDGTLGYGIYVVSDSLWNYYITPTSGLLSPGGSTYLNFPVYANVPPGTYHAFIIFASDPDVGTDSIPVTFTVLAGAYPTLTIPTVTNVEPGPVSVPVHASYISNLGSFQYTIEYDPALLTYTGTSDWYSGIDAVTIGEPIPGHLTFVWAAETQGINIPDGNFFTLDFTWNGQAGQTSALAWSDAPTPREFGDYDGNIFVPLYINGQVSGGSTFNSTVSIEDVIVPNELATDSVVVPVHAQFAINPNCFQFTIEYESGMISFQRVINWNPTIVDPVMVEETTPGHITFQWCANTQGINITDGHFFDLVFSWPILMDDWWLSVPITWSDDPMPRNFFWGYGDTIPVNYINGSASGWILDGVHETTKESVKIYPNPASDYLNVEVGNDICKINVINNLGITVYEQNITGKKTITLNISGYRTGNYIVQLITKDGQTINRKMMKQ